MSRRELSPSYQGEAGKANREAMFRRWRQTVPWSDDAIATALFEEAEAQTDPYFAETYRRDAAFVLRGNLTARVLSVALGRLITHCFCGKKALYRQGNTGRCRAHRMVPNAAVQAQERRYASRQRDMEQTIQTFQAYERKSAAFKQYPGLHRRKAR